MNNSLEFVIYIFDVEVVGVFEVLEWSVGDYFQILSWKFMINDVIDIVLEVRMFVGIYRLVFGQIKRVE